MSFYIPLAIGIKSSDPFQSKYPVQTRQPLGRAPGPEGQPLPLLFYGGGSASPCGPVSKGRGNCYPVYVTRPRGLEVTRNSDKVLDARWRNAFGKPAKLPLPIHPPLHLSPRLLAQVSFSDREAYCSPGSGQGHLMAQHLPTEVRMFLWRRLVTVSGENQVPSGEEYIGSFVPKRVSFPCVY